MDQTPPHDDDMSSGDKPQKSKAKPKDDDFDDDIPF
jgi:hypothetical protein